MTAANSADAVQAAQLKYDAADEQAANTVSPASAYARGAVTMPIDPHVAADEASGRDSAGKLIATSGGIGDVATGFHSTSGESEMMWVGQTRQCLP